MSTHEADAREFETHRPSLLALAYRMLGDVGRAQDLVQDAWLRWHRREVEVDVPRAWLVTVVTRLCLNELDTARVRHEEARQNRLPEPVDLEAYGMSRIERCEDVSMAFLVLLERLQPAERAMLLLHEVFDFSHEEAAAQLGRSVASCRKLLERARARVAEGRRLVTSTREEQRRLLAAFVRATEQGDLDGLVATLAEDARLVTDGGPAGRRVGGLRDLVAPLDGARRVATFVVAAATAASAGGALTLAEHELNGQPAVVLSRDGALLGAILVSIAHARIVEVYFCADPERLRHVGSARG